MDAALKRLQALRGWAREEQRAKRILEQQTAALTEVTTNLLLFNTGSLCMLCLALSKDLTLAQETTTELSSQLKRLQKASADKERELREKANEGESQLQELSGLQRDVEKFKKVRLRLFFIGNGI